MQSEARTVGREAFFDEQLADDWYAAWTEHKQANRRPPQSGGGPDELLDLPAATRLLGYSSQSTIRGYLSRNDGYFPDADADADDVEDLPSGRVRRRWKRSTLQEFAVERRSSDSGSGQPFLTGGLIGSQTFPRPGPW